MNVGGRACQGARNACYMKMQREGQPTDIFGWEHGRRLRDCKDLIHRHYLDYLF